jgi:hypothetical protein
MYGMYFITICHLGAVGPEYNTIKIIFIYGPAKSLVKKLSNGCDINSVEHLASVSICLSVIYLTLSVSQTTQF